MNLIVASNDDFASINIKSQILENFKFEKAGFFENNELFVRAETYLATINSPHLYYDDIDKKFEKALGIEIENVIYLSRHKSQSKLKTLTVHPIGNFGKAEYGGRSEEIVYSSPNLMSSALKLLYKNASGSDYRISFEATHHGPYLEKNTFYIEIGGSEVQWRDKQASKVVALSIMEAIEKKYSSPPPVIIGIGGGHYAPRHTDVAIKHDVAFGHIVPTYAIENLKEKMLKKIIEKTPGAQNVY
ncbi:MAG: D-aminoacyl-tRNA deacylase, partial [Candidatus Thermoplasmatota archaeon]